MFGYDEPPRKMDSQISNRTCVHQGCRNAAEVLGWGQGGMSTKIRGKIRKPGVALCTCKRAPPPCSLEYVNGHLTSLASVFADRWVEPKMVVPSVRREFRINYFHLRSWPCDCDRRVFIFSSQKVGLLPHQTKCILLLRTTFPALSLVSEAPPRTVKCSIPFMWYSYGHGCV